MNIDTVAPEGADQLDRADPRLDLLADGVTPHHGTAHLGGRSWGATITVEAETADAALAEAIRIVLGAGHTAKLPAWPVGRIAIIRDDVDDEPAPVEELVGTSEACEILHVTRQRLFVLKSTRSFPAPVQNLSQGPVWYRSAIVAFNESRNRKGGRPARRSSTLGPEEG